MKFADIILPLPLNDHYTYSVPQSMEQTLQVGCRVKVSFGKNMKYIGIVENIHSTKPDDYAVKDIFQQLDLQPVVTPNQLKFWTWISQYYICPLGEVYNAALPAGLKGEDYKPKTETRVALASHLEPGKEEIVSNFLKRSQKQKVLFDTYLEMAGFGRFDELKPVAKTELLRITSSSSAAFNELVKKKIFTTYEFEVGRLDNCQYETQPLHKLSKVQQTAFDEIQTTFQTKDVTLLHGVTSSGKTEIYIHLIKEAISQGKQVLYLLPEIALTTQITQRLRNIFGNEMGVYHSKFSDAERVEVYQRQLSGNPYKLILGVRSSVFLPFMDLGLVIIDEEHETSYKQQDPAPRYHARSGAIMLAKQYGAKTLLGTATPSLETYSMAHSGKYGYVALTQRYKDIQLPEIEVVDIKRLKFQKRMKGVFSPVLLDAIGNALEKGEQAILFQNRRGYSNFIQCKTCGWVPRCEHCDVSLTYHKSKSAAVPATLVCHYCGKVYQLPSKCPACEEEHFIDIGVGTEKVEDQIKKHFPFARTIRMDIDTAHTRTAYEQIISDFSAHKYDILIGTQMVSKGLDFDNVSVVGILDADTMLNIPDFRSHERTFQVIAQVAGRAGRKNHKGKVVLQTRSVDAEVIPQVVENDYPTMFASQMEERKLFKYPPFHRLICVYLRHRDAGRLEILASDMARMLRQPFGERVLGPDRPPVSRVQSMYIRKIIIKMEKNASPSRIRTILRSVQQQLMQQPSANGLQVYYDVDPM
ncbi:MAG: primosomal protein N' [Bacteroidaceae bacterium]|nr:primosomal protein N' [Bacteroidaceae bacterium]